jgi:endonuclease/exonuclease/phosphatase family metal-dependent hydrolase
MRIKTLVVFLLIFRIILSKTLTIASYNVENLFDMRHDGTEYDIYVPGVWNLTSYRTKLRNISFVISKINADIISLQEVESATVIKDLKKQLRRDGVSYPYDAFVKSSRQAIGLGLLSKYPVVNVLQYNVTNSRPVMRCDIAVGDDTISVFSVHFPAKRHPESRRITAANTARRAIDSLAGRYEYYIVGDFNSDFDETVKSLSQGTDDTNGRTGINHVLRTFRSKAGEKPQVSIPPLADGEHYNPWIEVPLDDRWSYVFRGNKNTLDHILFPQSMTDTIGWRYVYGSFSHFIIPEIIRDGRPYSWQHNPSTKVHYNSGYSDHLPIVAKITNENISQSPKNRQEIGLNGWLTNHSSASLRFVRNTPEGFAIYELSGEKLSAVASVAKITAIADKDYKTLDMAIRGLGNLLVRSRIKNSENNLRWSHTSPATREVTSQGRYHAFRSENWTNIPLLSNISAGDTIEIEIRVQKESDYRIQFCLENLNGWYRQ